MPDNAAELPEELPPKSSKLPVVMGLLNMLLTGGVIAVVLLKPEPPPQIVMPAEGSTTKRSAPAPNAPVDGGPVVNDDEIRGPMLELRDIIVQLRNPEYDRYLRISFQVELKDEDDIPVVKAATPQIRDEFITYLADRTYEELRGQGGIKRTKHALYTRLKKVVSSNRLRGLYITNMVVQ
ncbi:MAG: hypothetical protein GY822_19715 [Deltaproteobacteria bacterium]|nr:hypothetical protein [Deltaproteobacteria bacterium]